jgi:hypothetical protein
VILFFFVLFPVYPRFSGGVRFFPYYRSPLSTPRLPPPSSTPLVRPPRRVPAPSVKAPSLPRRSWALVGALRGALPLVGARGRAARRIAACPPACPRSLALGALSAGRLGASRLRRGGCGSALSLRRDDEHQGSVSVCIVELGAVGVVCDGAADASEAASFGRLSRARRLFLPRRSPQRVADRRRSPLVNDAPWRSPAFNTVERRSGARRRVARGRRISDCVAAAPIREWQRNARRRMACNDNLRRSSNGEDRQ